jgi:hypothetical protein
LKKEIEKIKEIDADKLEPLLAYIGLHAIKSNNNRNIGEIELKKIASKLRSRFDIRMDNQGD